MNRNIRLGQLLTPFGIGQLVNFPNDETLMVCGLDAWEHSLEIRANNVGTDHIDLTELVIREPRLEQLLGVNHFRKPFPFRENGSRNTRLSIPAVRFPQWHYCIRCGVMGRIELTRQRNPSCGSEDCNGRMIPVRFVAVCPTGHIQDVPFMEWVHGDELNTEQNHILNYSAGKGSGDLSSIVISCSCGERRTLGGVMNNGALDNIQNCQGHRPWLGPSGIVNAQPCGNALRVLIRGGANVHYSVMRSALYLPDMGESMPQVAVKVIDKLRDLIVRMAGVDQDHLSLKLLLSGQVEVTSGQITGEELYEHVSQFLVDLESEQEFVIENEQDIRIQEYQYLNTGRNSENADFKAIVKEFGSSEIEQFLAQFFDRIVLIEKLRETRVFCGFSRISPEDGRTLQAKRSDLSLDDKDWLPAHVVYGEGIFIQFNNERIDQWLTNSGNFLGLIGRYHSIRNQRYDGYETRDINPAFVLMHTFTHLLINRLCFNCGYGSSALKERIYFSSDSDSRMNGVLVYTSSGDSEGSMGGLVRQGRINNFYSLVKDVIEDGRWCSADPVCMDVGINSGQGPDSLNGAACHNCAIVPETSCEEFNGLLDRSTLIGTHDNPEIGYFSH